MNQQIFHMLLSLFCWLGAILATILEGYMLYMMHSFPDPDVISALRRNALLVAPLLLLWLIAAIWFTVRWRKGNRNQKK